MQYHTGKLLFGQESLYEALKCADKENVFPTGTDIVAYSQKLRKFANFSTITDNTNGQIMAFAAFYDNNLKEKIAYLSFIYVYKPYRGQHLAKQLVQYIINYLQAKCFKYFKLEVHQNNDAAINLYRQFGFETLSETQTQTYIMQRAL